MSATFPSSGFSTPCRRFVMILAGVLCMGLLAACGNKGALYLANDETPVAEVAAPDALEDDAPLEFPRDGDDG